MDVSPASESRKSVTLHDVAQAANVSVAAVSQALNNVGTLRSETRERIRLVAKSLGYVPNRHAAGLRKRRSMVVGFVSNTESDTDSAKRWAHYYGMQLTELVQAAGRNGYTVTVIPDDRPDLLAIAQVDALYLADVRPDSPVILQAIEQAIPVVTYEYSIPGARSVAVSAGYDRATRAALDFLENKGHRRIGFLAEEDGYASDEIGKETYLTWCNERGLSPVISTGNYGRTNLEACVNELLAADVDAFFSFYEEGPSLQKILASKLQGRPGEVEIVALCLEDCDENTALGVSHVCVHPELAPALAVENMLLLLENRPDARSALELPITLNT